MIELSKTCEIGMKFCHRVSQVLFTLLDGRRDPKLISSGSIISLELTANIDFENVFLLTDGKAMNFPMYPISVHNFYYLLTQPFETKEITIFSLLHTLTLSFLLSFAVYQY